MSLNKFIWIDLEMTGLCVERDVVIEISAVVTDLNFQIIEKGPSIAIAQSCDFVDLMDDWNLTQHTKSGLIDEVLRSKTFLQEAEQKTLDFLQPIVEKGASPMCGNSICTDRRFLFKHMPLLESYFHYRNLDVSSIKIFANINGVEFKKPSDGGHRAQEDILRSIEEIKYYQKILFAIS